MGFYFLIDNCCFHFKTPYKLDFLFVFRQGAIKRKRIGKSVYFLSVRFSARATAGSAFYPCGKVRFRLRSAGRKTNISVAFGHLIYHFFTCLPDNATLVYASKVIE